MITSLQQDVNVKINYEGLVEHPRSSFLIYSLDFIAERFVYVLKPLISTAGGRFHFITVQGRHLFKETTFTVSTLPRAWLEPPHSLCSLRGLKAHAIPANVFGGSSNRNGFRWDEQCAVPDPEVAAFRSNQRDSASN